MLFVGDVHGKTEQYLRILESKKPERSLQIGDMGVGFAGVKLPVLDKYHRFIRGNHDAPDDCRLHPNYLMDYGFVPSENLFVIAGAWSIDWAHRTPGLSWWFDEELNENALEGAIAQFSLQKPEIVASHEAPSKAVDALLNPLLLKGGSSYFSEKKSCGQSRTSKAMQRMLDVHQPRHWIFGHYHVRRDFYVPGYNTLFHVLDELGTLDISKTS